MAASPLDHTLIAELDREINSTSALTVPVIAPFSGQVLHELPTSTTADVENSYGRARLAQIGWARAGFAHRRAVLLRAHDLILERTELLLDLMQSETGKTRGQAFEEVFQADRKSVV